MYCVGISGATNPPYPQPSQSETTPDHTPKLTPNTSVEPIPKNAYGTNASTIAPSPSGVTVSRILEVATSVLSPSPKFTIEMLPSASNPIR